MESTNISETERVCDVYVVSLETSIDLIKREPHEDVVVVNDDADHKETATTMSVSSTTNYVPDVSSMETKRTETEFQLKFVDESGDQAIKINLLNSVILLNGLDHFSFTNTVLKHLFKCNTYHYRVFTTFNGSFV